jgi:hypothetical protein
MYWWGVLALVIYVLVRHIDNYNRGYYDPH